MEIEEKKLDQIINAFNASKKSISSSESNNSGDSKLTEIEKEFIETCRPEMALIVYGTLAPNRPNHSVVEHIKGKWQKAKIKGKLTNRGWGAQSGFYGFCHANPEEQREIEPFVLFSDELVANWQYLDNFEGVDYKRILTKYELHTGEIGVGYIYAINEDHPAR